MRFPASVVVLLLAGMASAHADKPRPKPAAVPFDLLKTQHMVVNIKVNGKGPYRVIFDTGAPIMLLNNKVAKDSGIFPKNFKRPFFAPLGSVGDFKIKTLQLGELEVHDIKTIVMDHPTISLISKAVGPIEGIVGFSFFARFRMTIDYQKKEMTFVPTKYDPPDMLANVLKMVLRPGKQTQILAPAGQWGFQVYKDDKDEEPGVTVKEVVSGSPADKGGLKAGDRLLTLSGRWTDTVADCYIAAGFVLPGSEAVLVVSRDGKELQLKVKVVAGL
jgi:hypothetical protein